MGILRNSTITDGQTAGLASKQGDAFFQ